jgi:guanylate kinase
MNGPTPRKLVIISGPSGAGKSTVVRQLLKECPLPLRLSVSATTRKPRKDEQPGRDYHFLSPDEFAQRRQQNEFLECKEVFGRGDWYGTLRSEVEQGWTEGCWMVLEIDVEGAMSVIQECPQAITILLHPGSLAELERRLRQRATETEESIRRRLEVARREMQSLSKYRFEVVNQTVSQAVQDICNLLQKCI